MKKILITGASGFVGTCLVNQLLANGDFVVGMGTSIRHPFIQDNQRFEWVSADTSREGDWQKKIAAADVIINLAGQNIFRFWTKAYKKAIYDSRILTTRHIVNAIEKNANQLLLTTSAVGIYGDCGDQLLIEKNNHGTGFLSNVCVDWEREGLKARDKGTRVLVMRFGVILGAQGALAKMGPAFKMFVGGPLGNGSQWFPWIHIKDIEKGVQFLMDHEDLEGIFNFCAPEPVRQKDFAKSLGRVLNRPSFLPVPAFLVKSIMGELGKAFLESQRAIPGHLTDAGYTFLFSRVDSALDDILGK
ncbi:MAG: TIGR01777 family oxidoreductase [Pseudomonadota bacterium]